MRTAEEIRAYRKAYKEQKTTPATKFHLGYLFFLQATVVSGQLDKQDFQELLNIINTRLSTIENDTQLKEVYGEDKVTIIKLQIEALEFVLDKKDTNKN